MKAPVVLLDVFDTWERALRMAIRYVKSTNNKDKYKYKYLVKRVAPSQWAIFFRQRTEEP